MAQKVYGEMFHSNNIQTGMSYGNRSDIKKSAKKYRHWEERRQQSDSKTYGTKKFNTYDSIGTGSMIMFHGNNFYGQNSEC